MSGLMPYLKSLKVKGIETMPATVVMKKNPPKTYEEYYQAKVRLALSSVPEIQPCGECGWPTLRGYCCDFCGSDYPENGRDQRIQKLNDLELNYRKRVGRVPKSKIKG